MMIMKLTIEVYGKKSLINKQGYFQRFQKLTTVFSNCHRPKYCIIQWLDVANTSVHMAHYCTFMNMFMQLWVLKLKTDWNRSLNNIWTYTCRKHLQGNLSSVSCRNPKSLTPISSILKIKSNLKKFLSHTICLLSSVYKKFYILISCNLFLPEKKLFNLEKKCSLFLQYKLLCFNYSTRWDKCVWHMC